MTRFSEIVQRKLQPLFLLAMFGLLAWTPCACAGTGVLIPGGRQQPDPGLFSLDEMVLQILIDNGVARVQVRQIFANHSGDIQEGVYQFALPAKATVSDFAVWDDVARIPGLIMERRRAEQHPCCAPRAAAISHCQRIQPAAVDAE
jgi:hypothetical protein